MTIHMNLGPDSYDILVQRGLLAQAGQQLNLNRRVLVVTDTGVPAAYATTVAAQCRESVICTVETGEQSKSLEIFGHLLQTMLEHGFSRKDCVVAVGGGVVGDLAGFAASAGLAAGALVDAGAVAAAGAFVVAGAGVAAGAFVSAAAAGSG